MSRTIFSKYRNRVKTLQRRRDFLQSRIEHYQGNDPSHDKAEASAIDWALRCIEANEHTARLLIEEEANYHQL